MFETIKKLLGITPGKVQAPPARVTAPPPAPAPALPALLAVEEGPDMGVRFILARIRELQEELELLVNGGQQSHEYKARREALDQAWEDLQARARVWRRYTPAQKNGIRNSLAKQRQDHAQQTVISA